METDRRVREGFEDRSSHLLVRLYYLKKKTRQKVNKECGLTKTTETM